MAYKMAAIALASTAPIGVVAGFHDVPVGSAAGTKTSGPGDSAQLNLISLGHSLF